MNDERHIMKVLGLLFEQARQVILGDGPDGLRPSQFRVIDAVPPDRGITVSELAERVGMTKQGIGQFVTQLTEAGYLVTEAAADDRRMRIVRRTRLGLETTQQLAGLLRELEEHWAARVGRRRYQEFRTTLDEIAGADRR
jgi:DNA-binding MarR family transcriptional regulator